MFNNTEEQIDEPQIISLRQEVELRLHPFISSISYTNVDETSMNVYDSFLMSLFRSRHY